MRTTVEWPLWRYPGASLADDGRWVALTGPAELVLPAGVVLVDDGADGPVRADDFDAAAHVVRLRSSVGDAFDDLRLLASLPADRQPGHLLEHVRRFGTSPLCVHGRPMWHTDPARASDRGSCLAPGVPGVTGSGLRVVEVAQLAAYFDNVLDAAYRLRRRRARLPARLVHGLTAWPALVFGDLARAEAGRDGTVSAARGRQLVAATVGEFLRQCGARVGVSWIAHRRPEMVTHVEDSWGLYAAQAARRMSLDDEPAPTYACDVCAAPVLLPRTPREGDRVYCQQPECRREQWRRNKSRQRHERPAAAGGREGNGR